MAFFCKISQNLSQEKKFVRELFDFVKEEVFIGHLEKKSEDQAPKPIVQWQGSKILFEKTKEQKFLLLEK